MKDIKRIWKSYQNIRTTPPTLWNRTFVLLFYSRTNFTAQSDTPQNQSKNENLVSGITCAILRNGTFILLYSKVPNNPTRSDTPNMTHLYVIQTATILSPELGKVIKGPWKKKNENLKKLPKYQNNPCNNEKLDTIQGPKTPQMKRNTSTPAKQTKH